MNRHFGYVLLGLLCMLVSLPALAQAQAYHDDILFVSEKDGNPKIYAMRPDGSNVRRLIDYSDEDTSPAWSPDKTRIAFASRRNGNLDIYVMDSDGQKYPPADAQSRHIQRVADVVARWQADRLRLRRFGRKRHFSSSASTVARRAGSRARARGTSCSRPLGRRMEGASPMS